MILRVKLGYMKAAEDHQGPPQNLLVIPLSLHDEWSFWLDRLFYSYFFYAPHYATSHARSEH